MEIIFKGSPAEILEYIHDLNNKSYRNYHWVYIREPFLSKSVRKHIKANELNITCTIEYS